MKHINVEEVAKTNTLVDREKVEEALCMLTKLAEEGIFPVEARGGGRRRGVFLPNPGRQDPPNRMRSRRR